MTRGKTRIWIALSSLQDGESPADRSSRGEWIVSVAQDFGLNPLRRFFGGLDAAATNLVADAVRTILNGASDITVSPAANE